MLTIAVSPSHSCQWSTHKRVTVLLLCQVCLLCTAFSFTTPCRLNDSFVPATQWVTHRSHSTNSICHSVTRAFSFGVQSCNVHKCEIQLLYMKKFERICVTYEYCSFWYGLVRLSLTRLSHPNVCLEACCSFCRTSVPSLLLSPVRYALWPSDRLWLFIAVRYSAAFGFVSSCLSYCRSQWRMNVPIFRPQCSCFHTCSAVQHTNLGE
jgi:hypothetical protein